MCNSLEGGIARVEATACAGLSLSLFSRTFEFTEKLNGKGSQVKTEQIFLRVLHE